MTQNLSMVALLVLDLCHKIYLECPESLFSTPKSISAIFKQRSSSRPPPPLPPSDWSIMLKLGESKDKNKSSQSLAS